MNLNHTALILKKILTSPTIKKGSLGKDVVTCTFMSIKPNFKKIKRIDHE